MGRRALLIGAAGVVVGIWSEFAAFSWNEPLRWIPDLAVGWTFVGCGLVALSRKPRSRIGWLLLATGFTWFLGGFASVDVPPIGWIAGQSVYLHRGPLFHALLSFPSGRLTSPLDRATVVIGYATALLLPLAQGDIATLALGALLVAAAVRRHVTSVGAVRRSRSVGARAAAAVGGALSIGAALRLLVTSGDANEAVLLGYEVVLCWVAIGLTASLIGSTRERAAVTDLVVELTGSPRETLRDALAAALGDPTIEVGYWIPGTAPGTGPGTEKYVDASGEVIEVPGPGGERAVTPIELDGRPIGVLVHDPAILGDPELLASIAAATSLAASNARLQAEVRAQIDEVDASRRRLVEAGDAERRRLERRLREGAGHRLEALATDLREARALATGSDAALVGQAQAQLLRTVQELRELARGLHPAELQRLGLAGALQLLAQQGPVPIDVDATLPRLPRDAEAVAYFVCSEALANLSKHARATSGAISARVRDDRLVVEITDDGVGGADVRAGSGLRGIADRVDAVGGRLMIDSPVGGGTRLAAELPLGGEPP